ncbi:MAG TPA: DUF4440 domain-containing protein [Steroidobacteraceae bacterium]|jgi:uncharacterized protein (TIGR02246 family)
MKSYRIAFAAVAMLVGTAGCTITQSNVSQDKDRAAIEAFNKRYLGAINDGDANTLIALTVPDHIMMIPGQPVVSGKERLDAGSRRMAEQFNIRETWSPIETVIDGSHAYTRGTFSTTITPKAGGPARTTDGKFLRIYHKLPDGSWTMLIDSFSGDKPDAR